MKMGYSFTITLLFTTIHLIMGLVSNFDLPNGAIKTDYNYAHTPKINVKVIRLRISL